MSPNAPACNKRLGRGFTIIEMLVTVVIVGILASVALPMTEVAYQRTKEQELRRALREIRDALDAYKQAVETGHIVTGEGGSGYPASLEVLVNGVVDQKNSSAGRLYFLRRIPRDPFADTGLSPSQSWGKRSYASPPEDPKEGVDVFDVFSLSTATGLNGVPYRTW